MSGALVARETAWNVLGQAAPLLAALITVPLLLRSLGTERYGVLALAMLLLTSLVLLDLGAGRATSKLGSDALALGDHHAFADLARTSIALHLLLGLAAGAGLVALAGQLADRAGTAALRDEAAATIVVLGLTAPVLFALSAVRSLLQAAQRADLANAVAIPAGVLGFALPLAGAVLGWPLPALVTLVGVSQALALAATVVLLGRAVPGLWRPGVRVRTARALLGFGGWIAVSNLAGALLVYADRFTLMAVAGAAAVAHYAAPFDVISRLWIVPAGLVAALIPAFSAGRILGRAGDLYVVALRYLLLALAPPAIAVAVLADDLIGAWLGAEFAAAAAPVARVLAVGILVNALAHLPFALLYAHGRTRTVAVIHLAELVPYLVLLVALVIAHGPIGAAVAWALRATVDAALLFAAAASIAPEASLPRTARAIAGPGLAVVMLAGCAALAAGLAPGGAPRVAATAALVGVFGLFGWRVLVSAPHRALIGQAIRAGRPRRGAPA